ncbi:MAG: glycine cleavage T C-terminal barrel domain-containing protein [Kofleriaceae bacterium]
MLEAGLGFAVDLTKPSGFLGRDAVASLKAAGPLRQRLFQIQLKDPEPMMFHAEIVRRDGFPVGYLRAASYGHTLGAAVGLAMIRAPDGGAIDQCWIDTGTWDVEIAHSRYPALASLKPLFDPDNLKIRV